MVIHLGIQDALGERLFQAVEKAVRIKGRLRIGPSQKLIQDGIRNMRLFASRHGWAPFHPSCPPTHEIPDSLRRVPRMFYDYADSGSYTEGTYRANEADFAKIKLRQRVAVDISNRTLASSMVGQPVSMPVALAPTGLTGMQHADGEILAARAAAKAGVPFTLSTMSICSIEDVA